MIFTNSAIADDYLGVSVTSLTNDTMGIEVEFRVDLLYGTSITLVDIQDAFMNGLTGRDMDFVDPDSRVLREMINVTLPSKLVLLGVMFVCFFVLSCLSVVCLSVYLSVCPSLWILIVEY